MSAHRPIHHLTAHRALANVRTDIDRLRSSSWGLTPTSETQHSDLAAAAALNLETVARFISDCRRDANWDLLDRMFSGRQT